MARRKLGTAALAIFLAVFAFTDPHPGKAQTKHGCLNVIENGGIVGRYDLMDGTYVSLESPGSEANSPAIPSPDKQYTAYVDVNSGLIIMDRAGGKQTISLPVGAAFTDRLAWSPNSQHIALVVKVSKTDEPTYQLLIATLNQASLKTFTISDLADTVFPYFEWSLDSRYVAVNEQYRELNDGAVQGYYSVSISLYGIDGTTQPQLIKDAVGYQLCGEVCDSHAAFEWSSDGHTLFYVQHVPHSTTLLDAWAYTIDQQRSEQLAKKLTDYPIYNADDTYALIQWSVNSVIYAGILDTRQHDITTLDSGDSAPDMQWHGDLAIVRRTSSLVWSKADGTELHQLDISPAQFAYVPVPTFMSGGPVSASSVSVRDYAFTPDGKWLLLTTNEVIPNTHANQMSKVWLVNLNTGNFRSFDNMAISGESAISPNGQTVVLIDELVPQFDLYLVSLPSGNSTKINASNNANEPVENLGQFYQLVWSPDSTYFVLVPPFGGDVYVINRTGRVLRHFNTFPDLGDPPFFGTSWLACP